MKIEVWSDFSCPFCYIGKTRLEKAINTLGLEEKVEVSYKAFELNHEAPKVIDATSLEAFTKQKGVSKEKAEKIFEYTEEVAKQEGLLFNMRLAKMTNTFDAHRLTKWARKYNKEALLTKRLMKAYFEEGKNIASHETLLEFIKELNLDLNEAKEVLNSNAFSELVENEIDEAAQIGIQGVPFFVINRKYAISGAQPMEQFESTLKKIFKEENPFELIGDDSNTCKDGSCEF